MATHSVNVLIKARDEASKKFGVIGVSSKIMGTALKATARSIRWTFTRAFAGISASAKFAFSGISAMARRALNTIRTTIRRLTLAIAAAFTYSTYAAMKQQAAEVELAAALKMAGTYSNELMQKFKQQAAEIQKNTTYGDEYIMMLMRQAMTLGVTEDKLADAAKAAISLYEGFGGGRGKPEIFMRYYVDSIRGTSKSLDTYIGELRKAQTEEQRQAILQKNIAKGWDVAKSKTDHAAGSLKQMKNAIGDAVEAFGKPFLADITKTSKAIKRWANENQDKIAYFAERVHSYVTMVKDIFKAYIDFMKADWKEGFKKSLDATIVLFKAWGKSLKVIFEKIFTDIGANIVTWIANARNLRIIQKETARTLLKEEGARLPFGRKPMYGKGEIYATKEAADAAWDEAMRKAGDLVREAYKAGNYPELRKPTGVGTWGKVGEEIKKINREALDKIKNIMPDFARNVEKAFAENEKRLRDLAGKRYKPKPGLPGGGVPEGEAPTAFDRLTQKLEAREARLLTGAPGARYNESIRFAKSTQKNTSQTVKVLNKIDKKLEKSLINQSLGVVSLQLANFAW